MAKKDVSTVVKSNAEKEMIDEFTGLCFSRSSWQVWTDFIVATACSIANSIDKENEDFERREKEYTACVERLGGVEKCAKLFDYVVEALEENPEQDFLGNVFMNLNLGSHWKGQFFTPYCVCRTMAALTADGVTSEIKERGWASLNDPACGAGATLIAMANYLREVNVDYQNHILFVAQDIDRVAGLMCYIQLSLLGCAGYVTIADTMGNPQTGRNALFPQVKEGQEIWYTPMFCSEIWQMRIKWNIMDILFHGIGA
jgi:hypothetical protein